MQRSKKPALDSLHSVEVISVRKLEGVGPLRAFADIRIGSALVITQCAVMEGEDGLTAHMPRQIARDGHWRDIVLSVYDSLGDLYKQAILDAYAKEVDHESL